MKDCCLDHNMPKQLDDDDYNSYLSKFLAEEDYEISCTLATSLKEHCNAIDDSLFDEITAIRDVKAKCSKLDMSNWISEEHQLMKVVWLKKEIYCSYCCDRPSNVTMVDFLSSVLIIIFKHSFSIRNDGGKFHKVRHLFMQSIDAAFISLEHVVKEVVKSRQLANERINKTVYKLIESALKQYSKLIVSLLPLHIVITVKVLHILKENGLLNPEQLADILESLNIIVISVDLPLLTSLSDICERQRLHQLFLLNNPILASDQTDSIKWNHRRNTMNKSSSVKKIQSQVNHWNEVVFDNFFSLNVEQNNQFQSISLYQTNSIIDVINCWNNYVQMMKERFKHTADYEMLELYFALIKKLNLLCFPQIHVFKSINQEQDPSHQLQSLMINKHRMLLHKILSKSLMKLLLTKDKNKQSNCYISSIKSLEKIESYFYNNNYYRTLFIQKQPRSSKISPFDGEELFLSFQNTLLQWRMGLLFTALTLSENSNSSIMKDNNGQQCDENFYIKRWIDYLLFDLTTTVQKFLQLNHIDDDKLRFLVRTLLLAMTVFTLLAHLKSFPCDSNSSDSVNNDSIELRVLQLLQFTSSTLLVDNLQSNENTRKCKEFLDKLFIRGICYILYHRHQKNQVDDNDKIQIPTSSYQQRIQEFCQRNLQAIIDAWTNSEEVTHQEPIRGEETPLQSSKRRRVSYDITTTRRSVTVEKEINHMQPEMMNQSQKFPFLLFFLLFYLSGVFSVESLKRILKFNKLLTEKLHQSFNTWLINSMENKIITHSDSLFAVVFRANNVQNHQKSIRSDLHSLFNNFLHEFPAESHLPSSYSASSREIETIYQKYFLEQLLHSRDSEVTPCRDLSSLPNEILSLVLEFLPLKRLITVAGTCRTFHELVYSVNNTWQLQSATSAVLWRGIFQRRFPKADEYLVDILDAQEIIYDRSTVSSVCQHCLELSEMKMNNNSSKNTTKKSILKCCFDRKQSHHWELLFKERYQLLLHANKTVNNFRLCTLVGCTAVIKLKKNKTIKESIDAHIKDHLDQFLKYQHQQLKANSHKKSND